MEFQKRGLPHAHILLWLKKDKNEITPAYIDSIISAELPDKDKDPELYNAVTQYMMHGPCGTAKPKCACMINNNCSKKFSKMFKTEKTFDKNDNPV